jgi:endonuclease/exonuclease/phosphatase family metal-dependent hydrolase
MKKSILATLILITLFSCKKDEIDYENQRTAYFKNIIETPYNDSVIICVTFNIHLGFMALQDPWDKDEIGATINMVKEIARHLRILDPNIIAFQEVPLNRYNAEIKYFIEAIASEMNMNYSFGSHGYNDPSGIYPIYGEWGTAILSKYKILNINNIEVEYISKWEKRSMLDAYLEINSTTKIHAISLHYIPTEKGIPNTAKYLETFSEPTIVMGDFNYMGEIKNFTDIGVIDVDSTNFNTGVDRIFYSSGRFNCEGFGTIVDSLIIYPYQSISDHPANYGIFKPTYYYH